MAKPQLQPRLAKSLILISSITGFSRSDQDEILNIHVKPKGHSDEKNVKTQVRNDPLRSQTVSQVLESSLHSGFRELSSLFTPHKRPKSDKQLSGIIEAGFGDAVKVWPSAAHGIVDRDRSAGLLVEEDHRDLGFDTYLSRCFQLDRLRDDHLAATGAGDPRCYL